MTRKCFVAFKCNPDDRGHRQWRKSSSDAVLTVIALDGADGKWLQEMINDSSIELLLVRNRIREHRQAVSSRF